MKHVLLVSAMMLSLTTLAQATELPAAVAAGSPAAEATAAPAPEAVPLPAPRPAVLANPNQAILDHYRNLDPKKIIPGKLLAKAIVEYHTRLKDIKNPRYLTVIDYSQPSTQKRFYIIDMKSGAVWRTYVANGKGSEAKKNGQATAFGNDKRSHRSSVGVFLTRETYQGKHGLSLKLSGLSSTNSNALSRAIVIHGANYVQDKAVVQGRSYGCPALPMKYRTMVIDMIKGGSLILAASSVK